MEKGWIETHFDYERRPTWVVHIGKTPLGGIYPVRIQSMANTSTMDTDASVAQAIRIIHKGGEYVRFTAQGEREANNLAEIRRGLTQKGYETPLVADIHFNPKAAEVAALHIEKVRINPGNYVDSIKTSTLFEYTDEEYTAEIDKMRERFVPFLRQCSKRNVAIRIGVNHGSLSTRIMSRYGDTPEGMVASCMEFLDLCVKEQFFDVVISMKASNTVVMVAAVRLLVERMDQARYRFPLHLGVTEAGDGEDGRIKSAVGIGTLLAEGIGDTIRVSLSEDPEWEIPVARKLVDYITKRERHKPIEGHFDLSYSTTNPQRKTSKAIRNIGGGQPPIVLSIKKPQTIDSQTLCPDYWFELDGRISDGTNFYQYYSSKEWIEAASLTKDLAFAEIFCEQCNETTFESLRNHPETVIILRTDHINPVGAMKAFFHRLMIDRIENPVILSFDYPNANEEDLQIRAGADGGALFLSGFGDGLLLRNETVNQARLETIAFGVLQAVRLRITKTEFISCPGCGRTLFDLQKTIAEIKSKTSHLNHLKIGIMGCIVNGPGEMADADYGYVGAARGKVSLYKGKKCVEQNIDQSLALPKLIDLIKTNGDWIEPNHKG